MKLPSLKDFNFNDKNVLLRTSYDVPLITQKSKVPSKTRLASGGKDQKLRIEDTRRIDESFPTIEYLVKHRAKKIVIVSHLGRPDGKEISSLSLEPVAQYVDQKLGSLVEKYPCEVFVRENLRFDPEEESNNTHFAKHLAEGMDIYVNDAFACCHREHASIVAINKYLPGCFGLDCQKEIETLTKIKEQSTRPLVIIIGGVKDDKLKVAEKLSPWADQILIGGGLPKLIKGSKLKFKNWTIAKLTDSGKDITKASADKFVQIIFKAKTVIWAGPMGIYEDKRSQNGTREIAQGLVKSKAYRVIGGGDTENALVKFGLADKMDYICSGGGAMMDFLINGSLPGIDAIVNKNPKS